MPDMKLTAEVLLRIEGHTELHSVGTIDVPINITFNKKPRPGMRGTVLKIDESQLANNIEKAVDGSIPVEAPKPRPRRGQRY